MSDVINWLIDPLEYAFMQRALVVALACGLVCAVLSCWLTLLGWSLMGDAVSHAVLPGVVLSYVAGAPFAIGAFVFGAGAVALIGGLNRTSRVKEDAAIGIVFTGLFALGLVLVSVIPSEIDLFHILFGNVLGVSDGDIAQAVGIGIVALGALLHRRKDLVLYAFDPTHAHAIGLSPRRLEALLLGALALTVIVALQAVGIVLVVAMLITPGATAYLLTDRFDRMLLIAAAGSAAACVVGVYASYYADASTGGAIVVVLTLQFVLAYLLGPRGLLRSRRDRREPLPAPA
ncbi:metal ABC transporter permease [Patulibacter brassicae]|jgi:manganese transport system permease protein|uniref:Metal ABC transporter permease n=1 Tax=Patulibacter brassicae TaxID=1705717 RepID=A0ABU4VP70_9ACTN|nr:metal ABC transporter permease [Patulibacter brassicae]MDX8153642.1 metal ABC transporter permease [Patulibacter brassicae]